MSQNENRRFTRRSLVAEIGVQNGNLAEKVLLPCRNISMGGLFLESDLLFEVGEVVWLSFALPGIPVILRTHGKVVWVNKHPEENQAKNRPGMGVSFLDLSITDRAALGAYLCEN